ncbi:nucleotide sugar dehydrogenase [Haloarcula halobia]|uniref:nucleotide sugar dehydrogenase n=1 Tax=Haloarcula halobia TaxID=3033388 RepID=UPI0023EC59FE|nr:nucleotide sugar dehydrogenase [Halomicroarcula sp. XH51]
MSIPKEAEFSDVCIVGMGYVGCSLATVLAESGVQIQGLDIDEQIVERINRGECPIREDGITNLFETYAQEGRITATSSYDALADCSRIIVTVGTPLAESDPDLSAVKATTKAIALNLNSDDLLVYRSTLPAGVTEETIVPLLETHSTLRPGIDYALAFCPERMAEGSAYNDLTSLPVVVGGYTDSCIERVEEFWEGLGNETVSVSSPTTAELTKLADNWWIDLNIALANEIALLAEELGVDALEVIQAANTLPKGDNNVNILYPGAGVGGSCLVKDPWFIAKLGEKHGLELQTPRTSRAINEKMPDHVVDLVAQSVADTSGASVAVLGYAFKKGTDDTRNTPAKAIVEGLQKVDVEIEISDPFVTSTTIESEVGISPQGFRKHWRVRMQSCSSQGTRSTTL